MGSEPEKDGDVTGRVTDLTLEPGGKRVAPDISGSNRSKDRTRILAGAVLLQLWFTRGVDERSRHMMGSE